MDFVLERLYKDNRDTPAQKIIFSESGQSVSVICQILKSFRLNTVYSYCFLRKIVVMLTMRIILLPVYIIQYTIRHMLFTFLCIVGTMQIKKN